MQVRLRLSLTSPAQIVALAMLASAALYLQPAHADTNLLDLDLETLMTIKVGPSADASVKGLSEAYAGGQIARGGRIGILTTQDSMAAPFSLTHYTSEFIQNHQAASVGDVLQYDPSVRVARGFGNFQQVYKLRGFPIFSDDMTYNGLYGILPRQYLAAVAIERVEVLRGANSFLNGAAPGVSGSLGGVIDVIPKRAPKEDLTQVTLGAQSSEQHYLATDIARRSSDGSFGLRFNGVDSGGDTAIDGEARALDLAVLGADYRGIALRLSADLGYQDHQLTANQPSLTIAEGLAIPDAPDANLAQPWNTSNARDLFGTLRAEYDFNSQVTGWFAGGRRKGKEDSRFSAFLNVNNSDGDFSGSRFDVLHEDSINTGELGLRAKLQMGEIQHHLTLSISRFQNQSHNAYAIYNAFNSNLYRPADVDLPSNLNFAAGKFDNPLITNTAKTASLALADEFALLNESLLVSLGLRDQHMQEYNFDYNTGTQTSHYDEHQLTPLAGIVYKLSPRYSLYGNYLEGLLKGDIAPETNSNGAVANAGEALKPYQTKQVELGMKYDSGTLGASLSLFQIRKPLPGYSGDNRLELNRDQVHQGIEVTFYGQASSNLKVLGGTSFLSTDDQGKDAIGTPKIQANLDMEWTPSTWSDLALTGHLMHTGSQYANATNTQKVPAWNRLDLGMRYTTHLWDKHALILRANVENITNTHYWASVGGFPGAGYLTLGNPRSLLVSGTVNF
jgi:iron complex outermembrane receptor protein